MKAFFTVAALAITLTGVSGELLFPKQTGVHVPLSKRQAECSVPCSLTCTTTTFFGTLQDCTSLGVALEESTSLGISDFFVLGPGSHQEFKGAECLFNVINTEFFSETFCRSSMGDLGSQIAHACPGITGVCASQDGNWNLTVTFV